MFGIQLGSAGMFVITMTAFNKGMSHYVFVVYRNTIATITNLVGRNNNRNKHVYISFSYEKLWGGSD